MAQRAVRKQMASLGTSLFGRPAWRQARRGCRRQQQRPTLTVADAEAIRARRRPAGRSW